MREGILQEDIDRIWDHIQLSELAGKTLLITGGTGLIGSYFLYTIKKLNEIFGYKTRVYVVVHNGIPGWLSFLDGVAWAEIIKGDLSDASFCASLPCADYIVHAAGYGQPGMFLQDKLRTIRMNTRATDILLSKLAEGGKFLFVSTSEIYSGSRNIPYMESDYGCTTPQHRRGCYIEGKRCGEAICMAYREKGVNVIIGRVSLAYGPGFKKGDKRVLNDFIEKGETGVIQLLDSGSSGRIYCYAADTVEMLWNVLLRGTQPVYNIGGESQTTILGLAEKIAGIMNARVEIPDVSAGLEDAPEAVGMNIDRVKREFRKKEFVPLDEGLQRTVLWYKNEYKKI